MAIYNGFPIRLENSAIPYVEKCAFLHKTKIDNVYETFVIFG